MLESNGGERPPQPDENTSYRNKKTVLLRVGESAAALPEFSFWLNAVHRAVSEDDFWGLHFWEDIEARAQDLEMGVDDVAVEGEYLLGGGGEGSVGETEAGYWSALVLG